jgi:hypothetical protein
VQAAVAVVDSVYQSHAMGGQAVFVHTLKTLHGAPNPRVRIADFSGRASFLTFLTGDKLVVILEEAEPGRGRAPYYRMGYCRWIEGDPADPGTAILVQDARRTCENIREAERGQARMVDPTALRVWNPDGRSLGELEFQIRDFYTNRRREYWRRWANPAPWRPRTPWVWPEGPPPVPGE